MLALWRDLGDQTREAEAQTQLSWLLWLAGHGNLAVEAAAAAVAILERAATAGRPLAAAYAVLAQRVMVAGHDDAGALRWALRARELAAAP